MTTKHVLTLLVDEAVGETEGRRMLVDQILAMFPDAIVDGAGKVTPQNDQLAVTQQFRSPMWDRIADAVVHTVLTDIDAMVMEMRKSSSGDKQRIYKRALRDVQERIAEAWGIV